jgi:hypothetical protein
VLKPRSSLTGLAAAWAGPGLQLLAALVAEHVGELADQGLGDGEFLAGPASEWAPPGRRSRHRTSADDGGCEPRDSAPQPEQAAAGAGPSQHAHRSACSDHTFDGQVG